MLDTGIISSYTLLGHFTFWPSPKFELKSKISQKVKSVIAQSKLCS